MYCRFKTITRKEKRYNWRNISNRKKMDYPDIASISDEELVQATLKQQDLFAEIMNRYEKKLKRYVLRIGNFNNDEADDVLQEVFIKIYRNLNGFDTKLKFSSWAYRIAHNHVISVFRYNSARPVCWEVEESVIHNIADEIDIKSQMDDALLKEQIVATIAKLKPAHRDVLTLKFLEDKSYEEISDILAKPMGTIATLIHKAKKEFKSHWPENI